MKHAGGGDDMIIGYCDANDVVAEFEGKFALSEVFLVLPAGVVGVGAQAREPLSHFVEVVAVLLEEFESHAAGEDASIGNI